MGTNANPINTVQALLGMVWGLFMTTLAIRVFDRALQDDSPPPIIARYLTRDSADWVYAFAVFAYLLLVGSRLLDVEQSVGEVIRLRNSAAAFQFVRTAVVALVGSVCLSLITVWLYGVGSIQLAALPPMTLLAWIIVVFLKLERTPESPRSI